MLKVVKFGGSSLANSNQFKKVKNIIEQDESRKFVVVSAMGKSDKNDHKITDLLYLTAAHLKYGVDASFAVGKVDDGIVHVSARSPENINVGEVMKTLGGGGNPASGAARIEGETVEEVGKRLRKVLEPTGYNRHI